MRILIANDDGVYSPGLAALAEVAREFGEVRVVAPDVEMSSAGHSITAARPLSYKRTPIKRVEAYRVNGTPADCVALGVSQWEKVDVVLSGINLGSNLGNAIWHSGTLAAAKQAALMGLRGIAFSIPAAKDEPAFKLLKPALRKVLKVLLADSVLRLVNVNFPSVRPKGILWTRQAVKFYDGKIVEGKDPMGRKHYWFTVVPFTETEEGTDLWAVERGYVSITPLRVDLTSENELALMQARQPLDATARARKHKPRTVDDTGKEMTLGDRPIRKPEDGKRVEPRRREARRSARGAKRPKARAHHAPGIRNPAP
jgi:5'-nucleotidase